MSTGSLNQRAKRMKYLFIISLMSFSIVAGAQPTCVLTVNKVMNFSIYNPFNNQDDKSTGRLKIRCTGRGSVSYALSASAGTSGTFNARELPLVGGNTILYYNLFTDSARTIIWGDGSGSSQSITNSDSAPFTKNHSVYGKIPKSQTQAVPGNYQETLTVTMDY